MGNGIRMYFHHIGIVVPNVIEAASVYQLITQDNKSIYYEEVKNEGVILALIKNVEFLEPIDSESPVYRFLKTEKGVHHLCFAVEDIDAYVQQNKHRIRIIRKKHIGFMGKKTLFFVFRDQFKNCKYPIYELVEERLIFQPENSP